MGSQGTDAAAAAYLVFNIWFPLVLTKCLTWITAGHGYKQEKVLLVMDCAQNVWELFCRVFLKFV
jgi:hypothetical protein